MNFISNVFAGTLGALILVGCNGKEKETLQIDVPTLTATELDSCSQAVIRLKGNITADNGGEVLTRGFCYATDTNPTINDTYIVCDYGIGSFIGSFIGRITNGIFGLAFNTTYHARAYATNITGTGYGEEVTFTIWLNAPGPSVTDFEGNTYSSVKIGNQIWLQENLKSTKYYDGEPIPTETDNIEWGNLTSPAYCFYNNEVANKNTYGLLYNWYAVQTGKLCPLGWHVPTDEEWTILSDFLGGYDALGNAGGELKEAGYEHWLYPGNNRGAATNESGFTALPGGNRELNGPFYYITSSGYWWSSTEFDQDGFYRKLSFAQGEIERNTSSKRYGFSVRCIMDPSLGR